MDFKKLPSYYRPDHQKTITDYLKWYPDIKDTPFIGTEKLDGCNIQFAKFAGSGSWLVGSRTRWIGKICLENFTAEFARDDVLYNAKDVIMNGDYLYDLIHIDNYLYKGFSNNIQSIRLYGEMVGPGILGRVDYGTEKHIKIYSIWIDEVKLPPLATYKILKNAETDRLIIGRKIFFRNLAEVLAFDVNEYEAKNNLKFEGFVAEPHVKVYGIPTKGTFVLKLKTKWILEKENLSAKEKKPKEPLPPEPIVIVTGKP